VKVFGYPRGKVSKTAHPLNFRGNGIQAFAMEFDHIRKHGIPKGSKPRLSFQSSTICLFVKKNPDAYPLF
jgi:hypothetical protein